VKPGNLLVSKTDVVKLADFGIARATNQSSITQVGSVLGTAAYLSPEQARGEDAGPRADLYSLGVVAYQLLSGRLPYEATSLSELALKQQRESPLPLQQLNPKVPPELAESVATALAIEQVQRPADAMAFAEMLREGARGVPPFATGPTRHMGTSQATQVLSSRDVPTAATRVAKPQQVARRPRTVPAGAPVQRREVVSDRAARQPRRPSPLRRALRLTALLCVIIAVVVIIALIALGNSSTAVHLRTVAGHDAQSAIQSLRNLIDSNTK
jgi:serine/threonine-protein kinase